MKRATDLDILLVEDNPADMFLLKEMIRETSLGVHKLYEKDRLLDARKFLEGHHVDLILLDLSLPDSEGLNSYLNIRGDLNKTPVIILTGFSDRTTAVQAIKAGACDYLVKGEFNEGLLSRAIQYSIERKKQEEKIRQSEEKYRQMFYRNPSPAWIYDPETLQFLEVNFAAIEKYGFHKDEFIRMALKDVMPKEDIPLLMQSLGKIHTHGKLWKHKKKNGDMMIVEMTVFPIEYFGKKVMEAQINDMTEKLALEQALLFQKEKRQQEITKAVIIAQERERRYIGEELHDNINQILATVKLYLDLAIGNSLEKEELIKKSSKTINDIIEEIRKISRKLVSPGLRAGELTDLVDDLIVDVARATRIKFDVDITCLETADIKLDEKIAIYRIIQEQMNNIIKHAEASHITMRAFTDDEKLSIVIADNGKGFDLATSKRGIGITNIISRAEVFNGNVEIITSPGKGCRMKVVMDINNPCD